MAEEPKGTANTAPLVSLDAVVFDTETTGPDAVRDRIIQIGAVRLRGGALDLAHSFDRLVDPGIAVPDSSSAIHGLTSADVAGQPPFAQVYAAFEAFRAGAVVIGHSVGFDLALLKRECALAGIAWVPPRALDTRQLARIVRPSLSDHSLETLANWLGVTIEGRHTAHGDAVATGRLFLALLPLLRERGIRTLAEAQARCRALGDEATSLAAAGWEDPGQAAIMAREPELARIDSYPYSHRVSDIMNTPPALVDEAMPLEQVLKLLMERKISSVFVGTADNVRGIVTERDLLRAIAADGSAALASKAGDVMSGPLQSVRADAFIYRAIGRMSRLGLRHLGAVNDHGQVVGALSARDLLRLRAGDALKLGDQIEQAQEAAGLAGIWAQVPHVAEQLTGEGVDVRLIAAVISREMCALTRRAAQLGEAAMLANGEGPPPAPYALMVLGSGGRGESLLAADQDNAIVYDAPGEEGRVDEWFARLGEMIADMLDVTGVRYCKGGIMARNKPWRHSVEGWAALAGEWVRKAKPEDLMNVDIFFDLKAVHGDAGLADRILQTALTSGRDAYAFLKLLAQTASDFRPPIGFLGRLKTQNGRVDLKRGGLLPIVTLARVLAVRHGVMEHATPQRLAGVHARGIGSKSDFDALTNAHRLILGHILDQQIIDLHAGIPLSNSVETARLTRAELSELKEALGHLKTIDHMIQDLLFAHPA